MSASSIQKKMRWGVLVACVSVGVLCAFYAKYISICGFHVPIMDFFRWISMYGEKVHNGTISFLDFFFDVNEQMQPGAMAIFFGMLELSDYDMWPLVAVGNTLLCVKAVALAVLIFVPFLKQKKHILFGALSAIGVAAVCLNPNQWELVIEPFALVLAVREYLLYGIFLLFSIFFTKLFQVPFRKQLLYMTLLTVAVSVVSITILGSYFVGVLGAISIGGCILIVDQRKQIQSKQYLLGVIWAVGVLGTLSIYLSFTAGSVMNSVSASASMNLTAFLKGWCVFWGAAFVPQNYSESSLTLFYAVGATFTVISVVLLVMYFRKGLHKKSYFPLFLLAYGGVIALIIIVGRGTTYGIGGIASSRYCVESCMGVSGAVFLLAELVLQSDENNVGKILAYTSMTGVILSVVLCFRVELGIAPYRRIYQENISDCVLTIDLMDADDFSIFQAPEADVRKAVDFLRDNNLSIFHDIDAEHLFGDKGYQAINGIWDDGWACSDAQMLLQIGESGETILEIYIPFALPEDARIQMISDEMTLLDETISTSTESHKLVISGTPNSIMELRITTSFSFQNPPDVRDLSYLICAVSCE